MLIDFRKLFPQYNLSFTGVLHVGGNRGEEMPVYKEIGIRKQVWFEPNPEVFKRLKEAAHEYDNVYCFCIAAGNENKDDAVLHISNNDSQSSSFLELGTHKVEHPDVYFIKDIVVPMRRLEDFFTDAELFHLDLLNIDVQGYELEVLKGLGRVLEQFKAAYVEVNKDDVYVNCARIEQLDDHFNNFGLKRVAVKWAPNKNWGDALYIRQEIIT